MTSLLFRLLGFNRRTAERYHVQDLKLILMGKNSRENLLVDDLSVEGISFTYWDNGEPLDNVVDLDLRAGADFRLGLVKVKKVADVLIADNMTDMTRIRRFSGRFINISVPQLSNLRIFLKKHGFAGSAGG